MAPILVITIYQFINLIIINISRNIHKNRCCWLVFSILELTINETNLDESDIRFPDILSNNTSDNDNEMPTFLELPKQHIHVPKGKYFIWSEKTFFLILSVEL